MHATLHAALAKPHKYNGISGSRNMSSSNWRLKGGIFFDLAPTLTGVDVLLTASTLFYRTSLGEIPT